MADLPRLCHVVDLETLGLSALDTVAIDRAVHWAVAGAAAGIDWIQLRGGRSDACKLTTVARAIGTAISGTSTILMVNDRADVALLAAAGGVHLPAKGLPVAVVRRMSPTWLVARSAHNAVELDAAMGADYVIVGTIFPTPSKPGHAGLGLQAIANAVTTVRSPVLAIGGITPDRAAACRRAGASGVAGIRLFGDVPDALALAVSALRAAWARGA